MEIGKNLVLYIFPKDSTRGCTFGSNGQHYVRISFCAKLEKMQQALQRIKKNII